VWPVNSLLALADHRFVSLTTFRCSGAPVSTPVWVGRDGESLVVLTPVGSGKVKRLRSDPRVELRPCGRFGGVADGATAVRGTAELLRGRPRTPRLALHITAA
jgi:PPOX class probable F420-dependent enzyme